MATLARSSRYGPRVSASRGKNVKPIIQDFETKRGASRGAGVRASKFVNFDESAGEDEDMSDDDVEYSSGSFNENAAPFRYDRDGAAVYVGRKDSASVRESKAAARTAAKTAANRAKPSYSAKRAQALNDREGGVELFQQQRLDALDAAKAARGPLSKRDSRAFGRVQARSKEVKGTSKAAIKKILAQYPGEKRGQESRVGARAPGMGFWPISTRTATALLAFARANSSVDQKTWTSINNGEQAPREYRLAKWISNNIDSLYGRLKAAGLADAIVRDYAVNRAAFFRGTSAGDRKKAASNLTAFASRQMGARSLKNLSFEGTALSGLTLRSVDSRALQSELDRMLRNRRTSPKNIQNVLAALAYTEQVIAIAQSQRNQRVSAFADTLSGPVAAELRAAMKVGSADIAAAERAAQDLNKEGGKKLTTGRRVTRKNSSNIGLDE